MVVSRLRLVLVPRRVKGRCLGERRCATATGIVPDGPDPPHRWRSTSRSSRRDPEGQASNRAAFINNGPNISRPFVQRDRPGAQDLHQGLPGAIADVTRVDSRRFFQFVKNVRGAK